MVEVIFIGKMEWRRAWIDLQVKNREMNVGSDWLLKYKLNGVKTSNGRTQGSMCHHKQFGAFAKE